MKLSLIAPLGFACICTIGLLSGALAAPRRFAVVTDVPASDPVAPIESAADGEVRTMVRFDRARKTAAVARVWTCDVVELAQGSGLVRRCEEVQ